MTATASYRTVSRRGRARTVRRLPRTARREVILRAAADVVGRRGYAAASMDDVAAAAGVTKLILYRHFASKADLYRATLERVGERVCERFAEHVEADGFGVGTRSLLALAREEPAAFELFWRQAGQEPEFARHVGRLRARAIAATRSTLADRVPKEFREWAAHAVVGYLVEAVLNWLKFGDPARDPQFVRATDKALRAGVRAWSEISGLDGTMAKERTISTDTPRSPMSLLLGCQAIGKAYGSVALFEQLSFGLFEGDRVGLVGPNGSGKSTLLRIIAGLDTPDSGTRSVRKLLRLSYVAQDNNFPGEQSLEEIVTAELDDDHLEPDERHTRVNAALAKAGFSDAQLRAATLSGGWRKRLAIACALVRAPDLLLLDEPTNHLDVEGIVWLEKLLGGDAFAYLAVSHDRYFLENVTNRIIELDPCHPTGVLDTRGNYSAFLEKKDELLRGQERYRETLANRVRREVEWLRRGPKARTRKSGARIQEAVQLQDELAVATRRLSTRAVRLELNASERKTTRLLVVEQITKRLGDRTLLVGLDLTLTPGTRLGILGANGSGKTTLLRLLTGDLAADSGRITRADGLRIVYLDQHREQVDGTLSLRRALAPHGDQVVYRDRPIHVASWARRFLFASEQLEMPVARLSGGEQARVSIARLMLRPADLLILDEPTNDLDIPTLEVLEESLLEFPGALVLVTHDRFLFDRVSTRVLALDGMGHAEFFADYRQWREAQRGPAPTPPPANAGAASGGRSRPSPTGRRRLTYTERREWDEMEKRILAAEQALAAYRAAVDDPSIAADAAVLQERYAGMRAAQDEVDRLYARWAELEEKQTAP